ncbi:bifunctional UDP-N-acetylglucosamine diphosphorylase/glucosamine-1-phosphate N-acetyltransferase GlmU [Marinomonas mediterranea]|jgi:UDP-N-acetylglucosamine pyrophosphorylase (EC 2.7.7.23)/glucosamine-1-phosphate N-acetyltransferase (EC 2.3.1.157)|uniref:Bifunctional protein GlmU n=1 Tax=Marinomonas mediterranea (strain ATCC 700492 / JCM 21426 / NBRC 103028 / MMB-1) TaxID=717774 RepID=F2K153_MARM1|nr:bifunctional UDP-N-acetylglucosamine diphosphorylase/glucosamine-1-phosphate N-acetyltransferase GlmU [Marinomonas mediterranea]ADZ89903.1 Bifunctional protein glmU [Marinomonas mediterranea MMB-1]WCN07987.1 UDP-N-acetylglucosamine diphosphorylase/glucosamine-1-phosphate N-acetyltransferase [Marinomonas mediterranea]WCN12082.1 UDP-N-acetylglucosamine diphosphorylase/glucosamine-1-phosphate N-acetyltransferase [Marinomonas mediterranea]WCN16120.1 UDP-N-acetylglucosamine diphosphorylase/glucos
MTQDIVVLAAGKGSRMKSSLPKVLHRLANEPMVHRVLNVASCLSDSKLHLVVGHQGEVVEQSCQKFNANIVWQHNPQGTGDALRRASSSLNDNGATLTLYGDVPLIRKETLERMISLSSFNTLVLLTIVLDDPSGYGRIVRDELGRVIAIVEQKDANDDELAINEVNTGILLAPNAHLKRWLNALTNENVQNEYYLTDIIEMAAKEGVEIVTVSPEFEWEVSGVNDRVQLAALERVWQCRQSEAVMRNGATLMDPSRIDIRGSLSTGQDCVIDVNCVFDGDVDLGKGVHIGPNCILKNCSIADGTVIKANTMIEDSVVGECCEIGPFARLRPGTKLAKKAKIGNFVETKKTVIGEGSKVNHLSYIGDACLGSAVNVGAGTITCNYDGVNKSETLIGDNVFVGSNTSIVAPIEVQSGATIAAGSTITKTIKADQLAFGRAKQMNKDGWKRPTKREK